MITLTSAVLTLAAVMLARLIFDAITIYSRIGGAR